MAGRKASRNCTQVNLDNQQRQGNIVACCCETFSWGDHFMGAMDLKCALRTLYEEIVEFRFEYPLIAVPEAGPKESLHYYWYKYSATPPSRPAIRLDANGIAQCWTRANGTVYRPGFVAMYALDNLEKYLRGGDRAHLGIFLNQINWLEEHSVTRTDGAVVWPNNFDLWEGTTLLRAPWLSSHVQGLVISALVRALRITRRASLLELLKGSARVYQLDCECNGLRVRSTGHVVYTERPGFPAPGIMDGFMTSLLGLYDLYIETGEAEVYDLFRQGTEGLRYFLPRWDYRKKWSFYANRAYLCSPGYHYLNRLLLIVLARLTGCASFAEYAESWNHDRLSALDRAEIYLGFLLTKNARRLRNRTWVRKAAVVSNPPAENLSISASSSSTCDIFQPPSCPQR